MYSTSISTELNVLIDASKISLISFKSGEKFNKINWEKLIQLADYHSFKPILYENIAALNPTRSVADELQKFSRDLAVSNLISSTEFVRVSNLLSGNEIKFLPYKGHLFLEILFRGKQLRSIGDLDILVLPVDAEKALSILVNNGYYFKNLSSEIKLSNNELIETLPNTFGMNETTLIKKINWKSHFIDFHWGFHYSFLPYQIDLTKLFEDKSTFKINGVECIGPSDFALFIMLVIHHGGRDCWTSLKYMADLLAFMETKGDKIDWPAMILTMTEMKLKRPMLMGFLLLKHYFEYPIPIEIESEFAKNNINEKLALPIVDYWENCYDILSFRGRLKYEKILWSIQDEGFSLVKYFKELFKMYSIPNPIESPRLVTFPKNYYALNAFSKIITYLYKRGFGKVVR
ncbi:MAG: nucleotidyltransferase family protein [Bacteroidota bacterium]